VTAVETAPGAQQVAAGTRELTDAEALNEAIREEMRRDPTVFVMGEDVAVWGGGRRRDGRVLRGGRCGTRRRSGD